MLSVVLLLSSQRVFVQRISSVWRMTQPNWNARCVSQFETMKWKENNQNNNKRNCVCRARGATLNITHATAHHHQPARSRKNKIPKLCIYSIITCLFSLPASSNDSGSFAVLLRVVVVRMGRAVVVVRNGSGVVSALRLASMLFLMSSFINALSTGFNSGRSFDE